MTRETRDDVANAVSGEVRRAAKGIPGLHHGWVGATQFSNMISIEIRMNGWSPTLNGISMRFDTAVCSRINGRATTLEEIVHEATTRLQAILDRQRERAKDAAARGMAKPASSGTVEHIDTDVAFARVVASVGKDPAGVLDGAMRRGHSDSNVDAKGGRILAVSGAHVAEYPIDEGHWIRVCLPHVKLRDAQGRHTVTWRGHEIEVPSAQLPDSVLTTLVGRPLGDLVMVHPLLDGRIIRKAQMKTDKARSAVVVGIDIETDPVPKVLAIAA